MTNRNTQGVITIVDGYSAASQAVNEIGPRYGSVVLAPLYYSSGYTYAGAYAAGTTYASGAIVATGDGNFYRSLSAGNVGNTPASSPAFWVAITGDSTRLNAVMAAVAGKGWDLHLLGTFLIDTAIAFPLSTIGTGDKAINVILEPHSALFSGVTNSYNNANSVFYAYPGVGAATTLAADTVVGATTITIASAAGWPASGYLWIYAPAVADNSQYGFMRAFTRSGTTLTIDRPLPQPFAFGGSGATVQVLTSRVESFHFKGYGAVISGSGTRIFDANCCKDCTFDGVLVDERYGKLNVGSSAFGWDVGSQDCGTTDVRAVSSTVGFVFRIESAEDCYFLRCDGETTHASGGFGSAFAPQDCINLRIIDCEAHDSEVGLYVTTNGFSGIGNVNLSVEGGRYRNNSYFGILNYPSIGTQISGNTIVEFNEKGVANFGAGSTLILNGLTLNRNNYGIYQNTGSGDLQAKNVLFNKNATADFFSNAWFVVDGFIANTVAQTPFLTQNAADGSFKNGICRDGKPTAGMQMFNNTGRLRFSRVDVVINSDSSNVFQGGNGSGSGAEWFWEHSVFTVAGGHIGDNAYYHSPTDTLWIGEGNDWSGIGAGTCTSGSFINEGTISATGDVTFPKITARSKVHVWLTTTGGTVTHEPQVVITPANKVAFTFAALDTSTYSYAFEK